MIKGYQDVLQGEARMELAEALGLGLGLGLELGLGLRLRLELRLRFARSWLRPFEPREITTEDLKISRFQDFNEIEAF